MLEFIYMYVYSKVANFNAKKIFIYIYSTFQNSFRYKLFNFTKIISYVNKIIYHKRKPVFLPTEIPDITQHCDHCECHTNYQKEEEIAKVLTFVIY